MKREQKESRRLSIHKANRERHRRNLKLAAQLRTQTEEVDAGETGAFENEAYVENAYALLPQYKRFTPILFHRKQSFLKRILNLFKKSTPQKT